MDVFVGVCDTQSDSIEATKQILLNSESKFPREVHAKTQTKCKTQNTVPNPQTRQRSVTIRDSDILFDRRTGNTGACIPTRLSEKPNVSVAGFTRLPPLKHS